MPRPRPSIARTALLAFLVASVFLAGAGRPGLARDGRADEVPESREPIEIGDLVLSLPALDGFQELPGLSDQLKGHWAGRLGRASIRIGYRVYPLDRFGFHDPVEVIDMLESNYSRRNEGYELDERETIRICVGYRIDNEVISTPPVIVDRYAEVEPVYEDMPGWQSSTVGITEYDALPQAARDYLARIEAIVDTPIDIVSTGPGREQTIVRRDPITG